MFHYGYGTLKKNSYQALYDNSEILGNNGYYYIDSYIPSKNIEVHFMDSSIIIILKIFGKTFSLVLGLIGMTSVK